MGNEKRGRYTLEFRQETTRPVESSCSRAEVSFVRQLESGSEYWERGTGYQL
jgi:hypothetical protein